ncbi:porin family protein [Roseibaca sp. Y0-43]|uniref:porin family protein n=1 Tax=Roseibaca sp. Y0-43 TaxID=2816854 RepID=UPI001D0C6443|nr:porin family protein [Roseibaca sp. Y0-43]
MGAAQGYAQAPVQDAPADVPRTSRPAPDPAVVATWRQALLHMRDGAPRAALPLLEQLVTAYPANGRFRLELARALYQTDDHDRARYHFEYALSGELSLGEINAAQEYLTAMDTRKSWRGQARIAIVPQSNPWRRSGRRFVDIGGVLLLPLPPVERAVGVEVGLGGTWIPRLAPDLHARFHVMATGQLFEDKAFNRGHLRSEIGFVSYGDLGRSFGMGITLQGAGGREGVIMKGAGIYAAFQRRFGRKTQLSVTANFDQLRYPTAPQFDGPRVTFGLGLRHILTPQLRLSGSLSLSHHRTEALFHRRSDAVVGVGAEYAFSGGFVTGLEASLGHTRFVEANPLLFQYGPQRDWSATLSTTVMHRDLTVYGFAPVVEFEVQRHKSNVPMRSFNNLKVSLGATRNF